MKHKIKEKLVAIPFFGYSLRVVNEIRKLPAKQDHAAQRLAVIEEKLSTIVDQVLKNNDDIKERVDSLTRVQDNLRYEVGQLHTVQNTPQQNISQDDRDLFANNHLLDVFYTAFEDRFRGDEKAITQRQEEYISDFKNSALDFKKYPVLDIGCGRGEFLETLKRHGIRGIGIDINSDMVERAKKKGMEAIQGDATQFLKEARSQSLGVITGFHIVEHIPFPALLELFSSAHRALKKDGFVIFETPNPENLVVGACNFYMDPSHLNPIPPALLAFALETMGFRKVEVRRIHPVDNPTTLEHDDLQNWFYGPRDYCVIGYR